MIELLVRSEGQKAITYTKVKDIEREITVPVPQEFTIGDIEKVRGKGWGKYFRESVGDHRKVVRVRNIKKRDWQVATLLEPLLDEKHQPIQRRRFYLDISKIPARKWKKKIVTIHSLKDMLLDKDNH